MKAGRRRPRPRSAHAVRVALAASALIGLVYASCAVALDSLAGRRMVDGVDATLRERLADVRAHGLFARSSDDDEADEAPVFLWTANPPQRPVPVNPGAPVITSAALTAFTGLTGPAAGPAVTVRLRAGAYRIAATRYHGGLLFAGQSLAEQGRLESVLRDGEALAAPVLLLAVFIGSLIIGLRALAPVERSRQRQLDFTADASHELRTPLSVIGAETSIALRGERDQAAYRAALTRIQGEGERLRAIVDDLLWLARFDSAPPPPRHEPVDLATIARQCADRFTPVAHTGAFEISVAEAGQAASARISAPAEWIDRLVGALVDNAGRYAGPGGQVRISVSHRGSRACLAVEDSGPGIAAGERDRLFDRFHRSTGPGGAAGLGLAIADSIVTSTSGQWRIGSSRLGGALFEVSWPRAR